MQSDSGQYVARLEITADGYADGMSLKTYASQVVANFDGAADPRIANSTITAKLTVTILEDGRQPLARCQRSRSGNRTVWQPDHPHGAGKK